jgi:hypothetical protein
MRVEYHPSVRQDVGEAMRRYKPGSGILANDFKAELRRVVAMARANLKRFPYHFIYCQIPEGIRVTLVRHHRRHPEDGIDRQ